MMIWYSVMIVVWCCVMKLAKWPVYAHVEAAAVQPTSSGESRRRIDNAQSAAGQCSDKVGHKFVSRPARHTGHVWHGVVNRHRGADRTGRPVGGARSKRSADTQTTPFGTGINASRSSKTLSVSATGKSSNRPHAALHLFISATHLDSCIRNFHHQLLYFGRHFSDREIRDRQRMFVPVRH